MPDEPEILEDHADTATKRRQGLARSFAQLLPEQSNPPARWSLRKVEKLEKGCLSGARWTCEEIESRAGETEIEVAQDFGPRAVAQADAVEFGDCRQLLSLPIASMRGCAPCQAPCITVYRLLNVPEEGF